MKNQRINENVRCFFYDSPKNGVIGGFTKKVNNWINGYVMLTRKHPFYGETEWDTCSEVDCHGGLTFCEPNYMEEVLIEAGFKMPRKYYVFGFDTNHAGDSPEKWTEERVYEETLELALQFQELFNYQPKINLPRLPAPLKSVNPGQHYFVLNYANHPFEVVHNNPEKSEIVCLAFRSEDDAKVWVEALLEARR